MNELEEYRTVLRELLPHKVQISGKIGSGKTYLATRIRDLITGDDPMMSLWQVFIESFADSLRKDVSSYFGIPETCFKDPAVKEQYRWMLIMWGNDLCRRYDPNWWVKKFDKRSSHSLSSVEYGQHYVICDDPRRLNEYEYCVDRGFTTIRITSDPRDTFEYLLRSGRTEAETHTLMADPTESELDFLDLQQPDGIIRLKAHPGNSEETLKELIWTLKNSQKL